MLRALCCAAFGVALLGCQPAVEPLDPARFEAGSKLFRTACAGCHNVENPSNHIGPHLYALLGREIATAEGFDYSTAAKDSSIVWTEAELDAFLAAPLAYLPGIKMGTPGVEDHAERSHLIYFLSRFGER